jgi:DNA-3-methyladenine glycosylase I
MKNPKRCSWATNDLNIPYHDDEWGVAVHDDRVHFEFLILEGAQAGLSWDTILRKRERYRDLFAQFDPQRVARFSPAKCERILQDAGIIRNRLKVFGAVQNARAFLQVQREFGSFDRYVWGFAGRKPDALSKDLRKRGFTFVGPTIVHSYMQAVGIVDGHSRTCFRRRA